MGLDDLRPFNFKHRSRIPIYGAADTLDTIRRVFHYIFDDQSHLTFVPQIDAHVLNGEPVELFGRQFVPVPVIHGKAKIYGYRFGNAAYLTDHSEIPAESLAMLEGLDVLFLDALRHHPHPTHSTVAASIETARLLKPKRTYFTHIGHDLAHAATEADLPAGIHLSYDGLEIDVE
jgi:phosphoribosyl 1,2-cyclic phosphate phosphodiesterase